MIYILRHFVCRHRAANFTQQRPFLLQVEEREVVDMKLGLLVVLAVVALLPSLSEGRIVSRCELREKLDQALILPEKLQRFREKILKIVICEANRRSHLNTGLVRVSGKHRTTTTARPTTAVTTTTATTTHRLPNQQLLNQQLSQPTTTTATTTQPMTTQPTTTTPTTQPTTTQLMTTTTTTQPTTTTATTTQPTTTESTTTQPTTTTATTTQTTTTESTTTQTTTQPTTTESTTTQTTTQPTTTQLTTTESTTTQTTTQPTTTQPTTTESTTSEGVGLRRKREADPTSSESDESLEDMLNELEGEVDEDDSTDSEDEESDEENSEEEAEEGGTRKKRHVGRWRIKKRQRGRGRGRPQSIGLYGLFQLSDLYFCKSGYHRSRNLCRTTCTAFTDDNIMDDINCIVRTHYFRTIVSQASHQCFFTQNFFDECA